MTKFTRLIDIASDAVAICEDGFRFQVQMDHEGAYVEQDGVAIYLDPTYHFVVRHEVEA